MVVKSFLEGVCRYIYILSSFLHQFDLFPSSVRPACVILKMALCIEEDAFEDVAVGLLLKSIY